LLIVSLLILAGCIGITAFLLCSNYQQANLFAQANKQFLQGSEQSIARAEMQLRQVIQNDNDNEAAYIMLAAIANKRKSYPEQVYYSFMAHRLNPLSRENAEKYVKSLFLARYFKRLESFLFQQQNLSDEWQQLLLYAAGRNGNINKYKTEHHSGKSGIVICFIYAKIPLLLSSKICSLANSPQPPPAKMYSN
jgi:hypothetical protein